MQLIAIETALEDFANGYVDFDEEHYASFSVYAGEDPEFTKIKKSRYKSYQQFAGVMGKFDPYAFFLKDPVPISKVTPEVVLEVKRKVFG